MIFIQTTVNEVKQNHQALQRRVVIMWWEGGWGGGDSSEVVSKNQIYKNHSKLNETKSLGASEEDGDTLV